MSTQNMDKGTDMDGHRHGHGHVHGHGNGQGHRHRHGHEQRYGSEYFEVNQCKLK